MSYNLTEPEKLALILLDSLHEGGYEGLSRAQVYLFFNKKLQKSFDELTKRGLINLGKLGDYTIDFYTLSESGKEVIMAQKLKIV